MRGALLLLLAAMSAAPAWAETRYVAPGGDDAAAGDRAHPWRSFHRATSGLAAGDRLVILPGDYRETLGLSVSGAPGRPIVVAGEGRPRITGFEDGVEIKGAWLEVTGLDAKASGGGSAIVLRPGAHHVRIARNVAHDSACAGIGAVGTDHLLIEENQVFGNSRRAPWQCSGVSIYEPVATDAAPGFHNVIRRNRVWDNMNVVVDDAISRSNGRTTDGNGIIADDFEHTQSPGAPYRHGTLIEGNTVFGNGGRGVHVFKSRNVVVVGNLAFHDLKDANLQRPAAEISTVMSAGVTVADNIAVPSGADPATMDAYASGANLWDFNLAAGPTPWAAPHSANRPGTGSRLGPTPGFLNASTDPAKADFRLRPGDLAQGAGVGVKLDGPRLVELDPRVRGPVGPGFPRL